MNAAAAIMGRMFLCQVNVLKHYAKQKSNSRLNQNMFTQRHKINKKALLNGSPTQRGKGRFKILIRQTF